MNKTGVCIFSMAIAFLLPGGIAHAQQTAVQNDKAAQLLAQPPASYQSEDAYALPWNMIAESDILWKKRVWRDIDATAETNKLFNGSNDRSLATILADGFFKGIYKAYGAADDRFTTTLTRQDFISLLAPGSQGFNPAQVTKYRIKEDWLFLAKEHKIVVRIIGIAPLHEVAGIDGKAMEQPAFWLYYPDIRNYLSQQKVAGNTQPQIQNWDQLFESRAFSSDIIKVSTSQPAGRN